MLPYSSHWSGQSEEAVSLSGGAYGTMVGEQDGRKVHYWLVGHEIFNPLAVVLRPMELSAVRLCLVTAGARRATGTTTLQWQCLGTEGIGLKGRGAHHWKLGLGFSS